MSVRTALRPGGSLLNAVRPGKRALRRGDRERILEAPEDRVLDSLNLDLALLDKSPAERRWDYLLGVQHGRGATTIGVEVHPATAKEASVVIAKKQAAQASLRSELVRGAVVTGWFWIASGSVALPATSREMRLLAQAGIRLTGRHLRLTDLR